MSFKKFLNDLELPGVIYAFGRFNAPHYEHEVLFKDLGKYAKQNKMDGLVYTSTVKNVKKNPLSYNDKMYFLEKIVPNNVKVVKDSSLKNAFQILEDLIKKSYIRIVFMVGEDRYQEFQSLYKYAKEWGKKYNQDENIQFKILKRKGTRTEGVSGTNMRKFAKENDFESFKRIAPIGLNNKEVKQMFIKTQEGLS